MKEYKIVFCYLLLVACFHVPIQSMQSPHVISQLPYIKELPLDVVRHTFLFFVNPKDLYIEPLKDEGPEEYATRLIEKATEVLFATKAFVLMWGKPDKETGSIEKLDKQLSNILGVQFQARHILSDSRSCFELNKRLSFPFRPRAEFHTLLFKALGSNYENVSVVLIEHGANVNMRTKSDTTPLHLAAGWNRDRIVTFLIKEGARVNVKNDNGYYPLTRAVQGGSVKTIVVLCKHGALINEKRNSLGFTPLHDAILCDASYEVVETLLFQGADPLIRDNTIFQKTPLESLESKWEYNTYNLDEYRQIIRLLETWEDVYYQENR